MDIVNRKLVDKFNVVEMLKNLFWWFRLDFDRIKMLVKLFRIIVMLSMLIWLDKMINLIKMLNRILVLVKVILIVKLWCLNKVMV